MPKSSPSTRRPVPTLTAWAIEELRQQIVLGTIPPGKRLALEQIATELGVSRIPLREAVRRLEAEGLVATTPHRGSETTHLRTQDALDAFALLEAAEMLAVDQAHFDNPKIVHRMETSLAAMRLHVGDGAPTEETLEDHRSFHFAMFDMVGEGVLLQTLRTLWHTCERFVMASFPRGHRAVHSLHEHEALVELFRTGEPEAVKAHLRNHLRSSLAAVQARLQEAENSQE